jgi:hypothetical protein
MLDEPQFAFSNDDDAHRPIAHDRLDPSGP